MCTDNLERGSGTFSDEFSDSFSSAFPIKWSDFWKCGNKFYSKEGKFA